MMQGVSMESAREHEGRDRVERGTSGRAPEVPDARQDPPLWRPALAIPGSVLFAVAWALGAITQRVDPRALGDYQLLDWLGSHRVEWLTRAALALDFVGGPTVTPWLTVAIALIMVACRRAVLGALVAGITFLSWLPGFFAKMLFTRARPPAEVHPVFQYTGAGANSFPSGHTSFVVALVIALAFALGVTGHLRRWAVVLGGLLVLCVAFARLYLGLHWPTDVIAGLFFGLGTALLLWPLATWLYALARRRWPRWA